MTQAPVRSGFFATFRGRGCDQSGSRFEVADRRLVMECQGLSLRVDGIGHLAVCRHPVRPLAVFFHGDLWGATSAQNLADNYARDGIAFVRNLEGSFALLVADGERGRAWIATDRTNSRRLCLSSRNDTLEVSTEHEHFVTKDAVIDPISLAWYLTHGVIHGSRTILKGVRRMGRAALIQVDADGIDAEETYWTPVFTSEYAGRNRADVKRELSEILIDSVDQMCAAHETDVNDLLLRMKRSVDIQDANAFIYIDQKQPNVLLPWREKFASRAFRIVYPWLSNNLLEFMAKIPNAWRVDKDLYKETVREMLPETFSQPRSSFNGYVPDWQSELSEARSELCEALLPASSHNPLDAFLDPAKVRQLLLRCPPTFDANRAVWRQVTHDRLRFAICRRIGRLADRRGPTETQRTTFLLRYLTMRRYLERAVERLTINDRDAEAVRGARE